MSNIQIRIAKPEDAPHLLEIYKPYVEKTAISFEYEVPSLDEFKKRMKNTLKKYPYLVAEEIIEETTALTSDLEFNDKNINAGKEILGYTYAGPFVGRAAYAWGIETTIYLKEDKKKLGIGKMLYKALERILKMQNVLNMNACIGYPDKDDEYLNKNSVEFHEHLGFRMVGEFYKCGYKFGRWYNMVWMEKIIGEHRENQAEVIDFSCLDENVINDCIR